MRYVVVSDNSKVTGLLISGEILAPGEKPKKYSCFERGDLETVQEKKNKLEELKYPAQILIMTEEDYEEIKNELLK